MTQQNRSISKATIPNFWVKTRSWRCYKIIKTSHNNTSKIYKQTYTILLNWLSTTLKLLTKIWEENQWWTMKHTLWRDILKIILNTMLVCIKVLTSTLFKLCLVIKYLSSIKRLRCSTTCRRLVPFFVSLCQFGVLLIPSWVLSISTSKQWTLRTSNMNEKKKICLPIMAQLIVMLTKKSVPWLNSDRQTKRMASGIS